MVNNVKILHFVIDDKFIDTAYEIFEKVAPGCNDFVLPTFSRKFNYIKKAPVKIIPKLSFLRQKFINSLSGYDFVIFHSLTLFDKEIVARANKNIKFVWLGWGYDYSNLLENNSNDLLGEKTLAIKKELTKIVLKKDTFFRFLKTIYIILFYKNRNNNEVFNRINYFCPVLKEEFDIIKEKKGFKFEYIDWNYFNPNTNKDLIKPLSGNNILVGNSATYENNHLEVFDLLKKLNINNRKIICPLNYGDTKYGDYIEKTGKNMFGNNFMALRTFLPVSDYAKLVSSCSHAIMNQKRQQAYGNILFLLSNGAKIFFNKKNLLYDFLKKLGISVFLFDEINEENISLNLSANEIEKNKKIIFSEEESKYQKTDNLIKTLIGQTE